MKACKLYYAILLIIIFKRKLSLLSQTVANIFTLIEPTAAAASKKKILLIFLFLNQPQMLRKNLADYYSCYSLSSFKEPSVCIAVIINAISAGTHLISPWLILVPHKMVKYCVNTGPYKSDLYLSQA